MSERACPVCTGPARLFLGDLYDDRYGYPGRFDLWRCERCGHKHLAADFSDEQLRSLYSNYYPRSTLSVEDFSPHREVSGWRAWFEGEYASAFRRVPPNVKVLDIGCGFAQSLAYHEARGCEAYGVEADANVLRLVERYGFKIHVGLFDPSLYPADTFDYVTLDQVIEHSVDPLALLRGVATVLKPGGRAIVSTPNAAGYGSRLFGRRWINWHVPYHLQQFSRSSVELLAQQAGLQVESIATVTNSSWLFFQWLHLWSCPHFAQPSAFWDPRRSAQKMSRAGYAIGLLLHRFKLFHLATRAADALGVGDNLLCSLRKPK